MAFSKAERWRASKGVAALRQGPSRRRRAHAVGVPHAPPFPGRPEHTAPAEFQHQMGWVLIAVQNAFYHLAAGHSVEAALIQTVGQGGDTDTNAAICGALLGAADGRASLPASWVMPVLTCRPDAGLHPARPRPDIYWPDDLLDLTEALLLRRAPS